MKYIFNKLTPKNNIEIEKTYVDALDFAIKEKDIRNIAISGNYGSGKSSFIETYKARNKKFNPIHISLARFNSLDKDIETTETPMGISAEKKSNVNQVNVVEGKIINQLLHQIDPKHIPLTIFKSKRNPEKYKIFCWRFFALLIALPTLFLLKYEDIATIGRSAFPYSMGSGFFLKTISYISIFSGISIIIWHLVKLQLHNKLVKAVSFKGMGVSGEIEVMQDTKTSYFDKYLDDVLYLIDNCQADTIIFEDIDRFEINIIFEKLREINKLANDRKRTQNNKIIEIALGAIDKLTNSRMANKNKKIMFLYLIKDNMFTSQERTKFFDFIIPIIPALSSNNSEDRLREELEKVKQEIPKIKISDRFIQDVSIYISDLRLMKNICNEFIIYRGVLSSQEESNKLHLSDEKIFAIITYKNLFPRDFSYLERSTGFLYHLLFEANNNWKNSKLKEIKSQIAELEEEDRSSDDETTKTKLKILRNEQKNIHSLKISDLISEKNLESELSKPEFSCIKNNKNRLIIPYLLKRGYIDEGYSDYLSYFLPHSLKKEDKEFLMAVKGGQTTDPLAPLKNIAEVYSRLDELDFKGDSILNFRLLKYMLRSKKQLIRDNLKYFLSPERAEFLASFLECKGIESPVRLTLLEKLVDSNQETLKSIFTSSDLEETTRSYACNLLLIYTTLEKYNLQEDTKEALADFINSKWGKIQELFKANEELTNDKVSTIQNNILYLNIKILEFNFSSIHSTISQFIYEHSLYAFNLDNIVKLLTYLDKTFTKDNLMSKPISYIKKFKPLHEYITNNLEEYIKQIIDASGIDIIDNTDDIYSVLNSSEINKETKELYLKRLKPNTLDVENIKPKYLIDLAIKNDRIICDTENIITYFNLSKEWNKNLIDFINSKTKITFDNNVFKKFDKEIQDCFFEKTALCDEIDNEHYKILLSQITWYFTSISGYEIPDDKIDILIDTGSISSERLNDVAQDLRERYPESVIKYLKKFLDEYIQQLKSSNTPELYSEDEILELLNEKLRDSQAINLAKKFDGVISIQNKSYSARLKEYILKEKFNIDDLTYIVQEYSTFKSVKIKQAIYHAVEDHMEEVIRGNFDIEKALLEKILSSNSDKIKLKHKQILFTRQISNFNQDEIEKISQSLKLRKIFEDINKAIQSHGKQRPKFDDNKINKNIVSYYKENKLISSYSKINNKIQIFPYKNK